MCSIGYGSATQPKREKRVRGTSLLGVLEGTVPPHSPKNLSAFGPLLVTLVHDRKSGVEKIAEQMTAEGHVFQSETILRSRG